jgi:hypothetical protein
VEENGLYDSDVQITAVGEIYEAYVIVQFVFEGQVNQPPTVPVAQVVAERNVSLLPLLTYSLSLHTDRHTHVVKKGGYVKSLLI